MTRSAAFVVATLLAQLSHAQGTDQVAPDAQKPPAPATAPGQADFTLELLDKENLSGPPEMRRVVELGHKLARTATRIRPNVVRLSIDAAPANGMAPVVLEASGFVLGPTGQVVTFGGVLHGARRVAVRFPNSPELRPRRARVVGIDETTDVGLLDVGPIELRDFAFSAKGPASEAPGDPTTRFVVTVAMVNDEAAPECRVSPGRLEATMCNPRIGQRSYAQVFELTILHPQSAGGVVAQADGQVVGLLLPPPMLLGTIDPPVSGMLALPTFLLREGVDRVLAGVERDAASKAPEGRVPKEGTWVAATRSARPAWVGFGATDLVEPQFLHHLGVTGAVVVDEVFESSPALAAGLEPNDVILRWNGEPVVDVQQLTGRIEAANPGAKVVLDCVRSLERRRFEVTLGAW